MPDGLPDLYTPLPDEAHEALRVVVVAAVEDLAAQVQRINDTFLLLVSTADFAQSTLNTAIAGQSAISQLQTKLGAVGALQEQLAELTARVAALEPPPIDVPAEEPSP